VTPPAKTNGQQVKAALPAEYRSIRLGMGIDAVKEALKQDAVFGYRGERDVSLLPTENRSLIESAGSYFISRSWFQFYKDNLYTVEIEGESDLQISNIKKDENNDYDYVFMHYIKKKEM